MNLLLAAHGTRRPSGVTMIGALAAQVSRLLDRTVQVGFVDVLGPTPSEILSDADSPAVVVPAFLARGYHVRTDLPAHVVASGNPDVVVTPALGPGRDITVLVAQQMTRSGWRPGDSVILAAAGTTDRRALDDLRTAAAMLSALTRSRVELAFAATGRPGVHEAVAAARHRGARRSGHRVVVASYLMADGMFQDRLRDCGADLVTPPLAANPGLAGLVAARFRRAVAPIAMESVGKKRVYRAA